MPTFIWTPDFEAGNSPVDNVNEYKFGDGYSQRQAVGINSSADSWSLTFNKREKAEGDAIEAFLRARKSVEAFDWIPPGKTTSIKVVCAKGMWSSRIVSGNLISITAKFDQVFEP